MRISKESLMMTKVVMPLVEPGNVNVNDPDLKFEFLSHTHQ